MLATMCDSLLLGTVPGSIQPHGQRCYGIEYVQSQNIAYFLAQGQATGVLGPLTGGAQGEICNNPEAVMWVAQSGAPPQALVLLFFSLCVLTASSSQRSTTPRVSDFNKAMP